MALTSGGCAPGSPIFSIDVHPGGTRFVTAGSDHKAKVWNLLPVLEVRQELARDCPRLLATLADHFAPVNVARFSRGGRLLATGSDDKLACLYELHAGAGASSFGSADGPNLENWKHAGTLRGHSNNVTDLAWAPGDAHLATCSLDNTVIVWDPKTMQKVGVAHHNHGLFWCAGCPLMMLLMMHQPYLHQPWRLDRCAIYMAG